VKVSSDAFRRGLRTLIDVVLSAGSSGLLLLLLSSLGIHTSPTAFASLLAALTPVLSVIKNALEDHTGKSFLVDKTRPSPDPVTQTTLPVVQGSDSTANTDPVLPPPGPPTDPAFPPNIPMLRRAGAGPLDPHAEPVVWGQVPTGYILVAVAAEDVVEGDDVVGVTR
jgi:hypothetical protein